MDKHKPKGKRTMEKKAQMGSGFKGKEGLRVALLTLSLWIRTVNWILCMITVLKNETNSSNILKFQK